MPPAAALEAWGGTGTPGQPRPLPGLSTWHLPYARPTEKLGPGHVEVGGTFSGALGGTRGGRLHPSPTGSPAPPRRPRTCQSSRRPLSVNTRQDRSRSRTWWPWRTTSRRGQPCRAGEEPAARPERRQPGPISRGPCGGSIRTMSSPPEQPPTSEGDRHPRRHAVVGKSRALGWDIVLRRGRGDTDCRNSGQEPASRVQKGSQNGQGAPKLAAVGPLRVPQGHAPGGDSAGWRCRPPAARLPPAGCW